VSSVCRRNARGLTLLELLVAIVVIALAGVALMGTLGYVASTSGESLAETQARSIAEAYLAEALAQPFAEPGALDNQVGRTNLNDVDDYNGIADANARDQSGNAFGGAGQFQVNVAVVNSGGLGGLPAAAVKRVDVTVRSTGGVRVIATGYRTAHP
jgi:prepilin-type N-terminal cleavage/methylation domain-containing protein